MESTASNHVAHGPVAKKTTAKRALHLPADGDASLGFESMKGSAARSVGVLAHVYLLGFSCWLWSAELVLGKVPPLHTEIFYTLRVDPPAQRLTEAQRIA